MTPTARRRQPFPVFVPPAGLDVDQVLELAAVQLAVGGWCRRRPVDRSGAMCADAAVCFVLTGDPNRVPAGNADQVRLYVRVLDELVLACGGEPVSRWNDRARARDEVVRLFVDAAAAYRRRARAAAAAAAGPVVERGAVA